MFLLRRSKLVNFKADSVTSLNRAGCLRHACIAGVPKTKYCLLRCLYLSFVVPQFHEWMMCSCQIHTDSTTTTVRRSYLDAMPNCDPRRSSSFARVNLVNHIADAGAVSRTVTSLSESETGQCNIMFPYVLDIYL